MTIRDYDEGMGGQGRRGGEGEVREKGEERGGEWEGRERREGEVYP